MDASVKRFFVDGRLTHVPKKQTAKHIVLEHVSKCFVKEKIYTEQEINHLLGEFIDDIPLLRRALVDYHYLTRTDDGRKYWVSN